MDYRPTLASLEQSPGHQRHEGFQKGGLGPGHVGSLTYVTDKNLSTCQLETPWGENAGLQRDGQQPLVWPCMLMEGWRRGAGPEAEPGRVTQLGASSVQPLRGALL